MTPERLTIDARGRAVRVLDLGVHPRGRSGDPVVEHVRGLLGAVSSNRLPGLPPAGRWSMWLLALLAAASTLTVLWLPVVPAPSWTLVLSVMFMFVLLRARPKPAPGADRGAEQARATLLRHGRCATCGYAMDGLPADEQGAVECPECGSAWPLDELATLLDPAIEAVIRPEDPAGRPRIRTPTVDDARGAVVATVPIASLASTAVQRGMGDERAWALERRVRGAVRGPRRLLALLGVVALVTPVVLIAVMLRPLVGGGVPVTMIIALMMLTILMSGLALGLWRTLRWRSHSLGPLIADAMLCRSACPGCAAPLDGRPITGDVAVCGVCRAAWRFPGGGYPSLWPIRPPAGHAR